MARSHSSRRQTAQYIEDSDALILTGTLRFMRVLWLLDHALSRRSKIMGSQLGITGPQRLVLRVIGRHPGISPGTIAKTLHVDKSTLTGVLQRLERRGMIVRKADPSDGRRAVLELTRRGRTLNESNSGTVEARVARALRRVSVAQRRAAEKLLVVLAQELSDDS
jgi:MarR family transcriptional regulator, organic hydroperoxide resistance regulator